MTVPTLMLDDLAAQINSEHASALEHAESAVAYARRAGALLIEAKKQVAHKHWLAEHCAGISDRTARSYMRVAGNPQIEGASIREALAKLAKPRTSSNRKRAANLEVGSTGVRKTGLSDPPSDDPPPSVTAEDGAPTPEELAEFEAFEREQLATFEKLLVSDEPLRTAHEELTRKNHEIAALKVSRDGFMNGKEAARQMVKDLRHALEGKDGEIAAQAAEIRRLVEEIDSLREENDRLRERIAIMEEAA